MEMSPQPIVPAGTGDAGSSFMVLTFEFNGEMFGLEVANVHEVIDPLPLTLVPNADPFAPGLINARGAVVPVLDLQHRLGMPRREQTSDTRFVILETAIDDDRTKFALIADSVHEVVEMDDSMIQPAPELGMKWPADYIRGIAQNGETLVIFLNTHTVFQPVSAA